MPVVVPPSGPFAELPGQQKAVPEVSSAHVKCWLGLMAMYGPPGTCANVAEGPPSLPGLREPLSFDPQQYAAPFVSMAHVFVRPTRIHLNVRFEKTGVGVVWQGTRGLALHVSLDAPAWP